MAIASKADCKEADREPQNNLHFQKRRRPVSTDRQRDARRDSDPRLLCTTTIEIARSLRGLCAKRMECARLAGAVEHRSRTGVKSVGKPAALHTLRAIRCRPV